MTCYLFHIRDEGQTWWTMTDLVHVLIGRPKEAKAKLIDRWLARYGKPDKIVRYQGYHRQSEVAMTLAALKRGVQ
jgi:hypothetical protein